MRLSHIAATATLIMAGLMGCASSHTKPRHEHVSPRHSYNTAREPAHSHVHGASKAARHGHYPVERHHPAERHRSSRRFPKPAPPPMPGRTPDGRYVLPGGLESVCAGGTPPPCQ